MTVLEVLMTPISPNQVTDALLPAVYEQIEPGKTGPKTELRGGAPLKLSRAQAADKAGLSRLQRKDAADETLEKKSHLVRNRAIRRKGQVLEQIEPTKNQHSAKGGTSLSRVQAAEKAGLSDHQQKNAMRLAAIPEDEFEELTATAGPQPGRIERVCPAILFHAQRQRNRQGFPNAKRTLFGNPLRQIEIELIRNGQ